MAKVLTALDARTVPHNLAPANLGTKKRKLPNGGKRVPELVVHFASRETEVIPDEGGVRGGDLQLHRVDFSSSSSSKAKEGNSAFSFPPGSTRRGPRRS